jgi:hypothetical protein
VELLICVSTDPLFGSAKRQKFDRSEPNALQIYAIACSQEQEPTNTQAARANIDGVLTLVRPEDLVPQAYIPQWRAKFDERKGTSILSVIILSLSYLFGSGR